MDLPCSCNDAGKRLFQAITGFAGRNMAPLDEVLQLHQSVHLLGPGIRECLTCSTNDEVMLRLLDGLATLRVLYEALSSRYSAKPGGGAGRVLCHTRGPPICSRDPLPDDAAAGREAERTEEEGGRGRGGGPAGFDLRSTPHPPPNLAVPTVLLGRIGLTESEANLVAMTLIKQGLRQTGSHVRDLQHHLTKCLKARKIKDVNYDIYKRRLSEILTGIYSSLACI